MRARYVKELTEGSRVDATYVMRSKEARMARTGDAYLALTLADRTGAMPAVLFRPTAIASAVPVGAAVSVVGSVARYRGALRLRVDSLAPARAWSAEDFVPCSLRPATELEADFTALVRSVTDLRLRSVLRKIFGPASFRAEFFAAPASRSHHHAFRGGLVEHTIAVADVCSLLAQRYDGVDRDLLVTAALLHDVGRVDELSCDTRISHTDQGRLLGHVVLGLQRVKAALANGLADSDQAVLLQHVIVSHHEEFKYGASTGAATIEALILRHADDLDVKTAGFSSLLGGATSQNCERRAEVGESPDRMSA